MGRSRLKNKYRVYGDRVFVYLRGRLGGRFVVDRKDFEKIKMYTWYSTSSSSVEKRRKFNIRIRASVGRGHIGLSKLLLDPPIGTVVDHIDGDVFNNRRRNLRLASVKQNAQNRRHILRGKPRGTIPGCRWVPELKKYRVCFSVNGRQLHFGLFALRRDAYAVLKNLKNELYGEFSPYWKEKR